MNEDLLFLAEKTLWDYTERLLEMYRGNVEGHQEVMKILISNMPQKHPLASAMASNLGEEIGKERVLSEEVRALEESLSNYILFSNTCLYLEKRWPAKKMGELYERLFPQPEDRRMHCAVTRPPAKDGEGDEGEALAIQGAQAEIDFSALGGLSPDALKVLRSMFGAILDLEKQTAVFSFRDLFTSYKISIIYKNNPKLCSYEMMLLLRLDGQVRLKDVISGILLGLVLHPDLKLYFYGLIIHLCRRDKNVIPSVVQLLLELGLGKGKGAGEAELSKLIVDLVPHLYMSISTPKPVDIKRSESLYSELQEDQFSSLLLLLNSRSAALLYELVDGRELPPMEIFEQCALSRSATDPSDEARAHIRSLLNLRHGGGAAPPAAETKDERREAGHRAFPESVTYEDLKSSGALGEFFVSFLRASDPSVAHFLHYLEIHIGVFGSLSGSEIGELVYLISRKKRSTVYKEIAINRLLHVAHSRKPSPT